MHNLPWVTSNKVLYILPVQYKWGIVCLRYHKYLKEPKAESHNDVSGSIGPFGPIGEQHRDELPQPYEVLYLVKVFNYSNRD